MRTLDYALTLGAVSPSIRGTATFPPNHAAFDGHFPGRPILPAFMQIQAAIDLLERAGQPCWLLRVADAKFLRPVAPDELMAIELSPVGPLSHAAVLTVQGERASQFTLTVGQAPAGSSQESAVPRVELP